MHKNNLLPVALLSLVAVGICFWSTQATKKRKTSYTPPPFSQLAVPEELRNELLSRVVTFFGEEGYKKLNNSFVVVGEALPFITVKQFYHKSAVD